jgi:mono/diheme cytochrome c family protein
MKMKICKLMIVFLLILVSSCKKNSSGTSSLYTPSSSDVTATATLQDLQQGRTLYMDNCNSCHGLYSPDDYTPTQWKSIISNMGPRTGMSSAQITLVTKYVTRGN